MSSDGKEPGATWQEPADASGSQSANQTPLDAEALPPLPSQQRRAAQQLHMPADFDPMPHADHSHTPDYLDESDSLDASDTDSDQAEQVSTPGELLKRLGQYFTLILAPLLFGALTCLFVLPLVAEGRASLPPEGFWPITLVIIAITIAQGVAVYYAGANQTLWVLATLGGFFFFLLIGCFSIFGLVSGLVLLLAIIAIAVALARLCVHPVAPDYVDIVFSFGKYSRTLYQGFNILLPWEKALFQVPIKETQWICPLQRVQLSHDDDVLLRALISYQVVPEDAHIAVTQVKNWEESLHQILVTTLQSVAATFIPQDFLIWPQGLHARTSASAPQQHADAFTGGPARREQINNTLFQQMRDKVALWGIQINKVHIQDIELTPHEASKPHPTAHPTAHPAQSTPTHDAKQPAQGTPNTHPQPAKVAHPAQAVKVEQAGQARGAPPHQEAQKHAPVTSTNVLKEEVLIKAYKEVQNGNITDPETIRGIAARFDAVSKDLQANQTVSFDAARAALNLYEQAQKYEEQYTMGTIYNDATKPDWAARRPTDENLMAGG